MPLIQTVILISLLQLATYALLDKFKLGKLKYLVLALSFQLRGDVYGSRGQDLYWQQRR